MIDFGPASPYPYDLRETPFFLFIALVGGLLGALFNALNARLCRWRREVLVLPQRRKTRVAEALAICFLTATVTYWLPAIFGACEPLPSFDDPSTPLARVDKSLGGTHADAHALYPRYRCAEGEWNPMAQYVFRGSVVCIKGMFHDEARHEVFELLTYTLAMFVLACITYGVAVPSGLFVPGILIGCGFGRLVGEIVKHQ